MLAALDDITVMTGRSLLHARRALDTLLISVILPVMLLLLFVHVFGGALAPAAGQYLTYVVPGIVVLCAGYGAASTGVAVTADLTSGAMDRFRSLPMLRPAVLIGHVTAGLVRNLAATALVFGVAWASGFRPAASLLDWAGIAALLTLFVLGVAWVSVCFGLVASSAESASAFSFVVLFLPYLSSAFVPVSTMPSWLRGVAGQQPMTPLIESLRALMTGAPVGDSALTAALWWGGVLALGYMAATLLFRRRMTR